MADNKPQINKDLLDLTKALKGVEKGLKGSTIKNITGGVSVMEEVNLNITSLNKNILIGNKQLISEIKKMTTAYIKNIEKEDPFKRKDPNAKILNELEQSNFYAKENLKMQGKLLSKFGKDSGFFGLLKTLLGGALALGGFLGYFLTGKKEFLNSMWKGILKYSPLSFISKMLDGVFTGIGKKVTKFFAKSLDIFTPLVKSLGLDNVVGKITGVFGKLFGKGAAKTGGKALGKGLGKAALKKIPVVGALMGLWFGIDRFKQGDWVGGLLEVASGISSIVPGVGTAIGMGIDAFLLFRDFKNAFAPKEEKQEEKKKINWEKVPVIGGFVQLFEGIKIFKTDKLKGVKQVLSGIAHIMPGTGIMLSLTEWLWDKFGNAEQDLTSGGGGPESDNIIPEKPNIFQSTIQKGSDLYNKGKEKVKIGMTNAMSVAKNTTINIAKKTASVATKVGSAVKKIGKMLGIKLMNPRVDFSGVNEGVLNNFIGMADEYNQLTGKSLHVNSAYRSPEAQAKLYEEAVRTGRTGFVAKPGRSLHERGYAVDINSADANALDSLGLLNKWGFWRPLLEPKVKNKEAWHIEPVGIDRKTAGIADSDTGKPQIGDRILESNVENNLPSMRIPSTKPIAEKPIVLSEATMNSLAEKIGYQFKRNMPEVKTGITPSRIKVRG